MLNVQSLPEQPGALYIEFNNPPMNQFTTELWSSLVDALNLARDDDSVHVVILSGAGERAFSGGLSMDMLDNIRGDEDSALIYDLGFEIREAIYGLGKPVLAAVKGNCVGGGLEIALCCDLIYAAENAKFMLPEMNIGLVPGCGGAIHLAQKTPLNRAFEMILFGDRLNAEEALRLGLVSKVFLNNEFDSSLRAVVDTILKKPPTAVRALKELMAHANVSPDETKALQIERRYAVELMRTHDFKEAVAAFREKRPPNFIGK